MPFSNLKRYGTNYGGFLLPSILNDIDENSVIYCFGAGEDISFDVELSITYKCSVHIFDPTPRAIEHVNMVKQSIRPTNNLHRYGGNDSSYLDMVFNEHVDSNKLILHEYGIHINDDYIDFYYPENNECVSLTVCKELSNQIENKIKLKVKSLKTIMKDLNHSKIDLLKLDIEGYECEIIIDMLENLEIFPRYICIDFDARRANQKIDLFNNVMTILFNHKYEVLLNSNFDISFERFI